MPYNHDNLIHVTPPLKSGALLQPRRHGGLRVGVVLFPYGYGE